MRNKTSKVDKELFGMLTECTGAVMCDSGGAYGRNWERNRGKTLADFMNEPEVSLETNNDGNVEFYIISVFHYLRGQLEIDVICQEFNRANRNADDWDDDRFYGVSTKAGKVLDGYHAEAQGGFISYNGEDFLSQVIQGEYCRIAKNGYVVLQIHGGCDVRGGYTNARLFKIVNDCGDTDFDCLAPQDVYGRYTPNDADLQTPTLLGVDVSVAECAGVIEISNCYDGYHLTEHNGNWEQIDLNINKGKIELWLPEY